MIFLKSSVKPKSLFIVCACSNVAQEMDIDITITSGNDSKHMTGSLHYENEAIDVRSKNFKNKDYKLAFVARVLNRLGKDYDGILEHSGQANEHFHFEYDPKH